MSDAAALSGHHRRQLAAAARVAEAQRRLRRQRIDRAEFDRVADAAVSTCCACRRTLGCDIVTDGELRRDNFYSFVAEKLDGVRLMTLAEMLDVVEDKAGFERLLQTLDVRRTRSAARSCAGKIERREPLAADDLRFVRRHTDRPVKVTLPGPYLLTRAMFVPEMTGAFYHDQGGSRRGRRRGAAGRARGAGRRGRRLRAVRRAGVDRAGVRAGQHAHVHVRGAGGAPGSRRGARAGRVADQPRGRGHSGRADRRARVPRELEPRRNDAAVAAAITRWRRISSA